jgi:peptide/nickel transport system permease protein
MSVKSISLIDFSDTPPKVGEFRRIVRICIRRRISLIGFIIILANILTAIFAPLLAPYDPYLQDLPNALLKPNLEHMLGTDSLGRDTLSRVIYGSRISLLVGIVAVGIAAIIGMTLGLVAGYFGGMIYTTIMRFIDILMTFPLLVFALVLAALFGGGLTNVMFAVGIALSSLYTRLMCGQVLTVKANEYILAAKSLGAKNTRIMLSHILPNCFPPLIVLITLNIGAAILSEAGLSFLGLGIEAPTAAWGAMVNDGYKYLLSNPFLSFAPGLAIMLLVFAFNMAGDGLRDALDPRLRGTL